LGRKERCPAGKGYTWLSTQAPPFRALITIGLSYPVLPCSAPKTVYFVGNCQNQGLNLLKP
jgi:hypothetical protein